MLTITHQANGYKLLFSNPGTGTRGVSIVVKTVCDIHVCIDHYFVKEHDRKNCPICKAGL